MKTAIASEPDPYEEYRSRYKMLMSNIASAFRRSGEFGRKRRVA